MPNFPNGYGAQVTAPSDIDGNDGFLMSVDGAIRNVAPSAARGFADAAHFTPGTLQLLESADTLTGWTLRGPSVSQIVRLQEATAALVVFGHTQGTNAVAGSLDLHSGVDSGLYYTFTSAQAIGTRSLVAIDVLFAIDGPVTESNLRASIACQISDGTGFTGNVTTVAFPSIPQGTWATVVLPLDDITAIKSVGIRKLYDPSGGTWTDSANYRGWVLIDNIRFLDDTKIDAALGSASTAAVFVPPDYPDDTNQLPLFIGENKGIFDVAKGVFSGLNKFVYLHDYLAHVPGAETGETDVASAIGRIINDALPGQIVRGSPGAIYRFDHGIEIRVDDITVDLHGSTMMVNYHNVDDDFVKIQATNTRITGGLWLGKGDKVRNGSGYTLVTGTPVTSGTTKLLAAQNDEVRSPAHTNFSAHGGLYARHLPQQLGLADDGLGPRYYFDFTLSDSAQVTNDCTIWIKDETNGTILTTSTVTLTGTPTVYRLSATVGDRLVTLRGHVKKNTATANTITLTSGVLYGQNEYDSNFDSASCFDLTNCRNIEIDDMWIEGFGGDAIQVSNANVHVLHINRVTSWGCRRQGMSFNQGTDFLIENCEVYATGRSAIDFEPYAADWFTQRVRVRNIYMDEITNYGFAMANWARNYDYSIESCVIAKSRFGMIFGGFQRGYMRDCVVRYGISTWDYEFMGTDMLIENLVSIVGIRCYDETNDSDIGSGVVVYTPTNNVLRNILITPPLGVNRRMLYVDTTGYRVDGITISEKVQATFVGGSTGSIGIHQSNAYSNVHFGEVARQLPNTFKGIAYSDVWVPGGFNSHDDAIHQVRGVSSTTTRSNNLAKVNVAVTQTATTLAVAFPTRNVGALTTASTAASNATAGSLASSTAYYYRIAPRELYAGPGVYLSQFTATTSSGHTAIAVTVLGMLNTANGKFSNAFTLLQGTTNGGPYTTRYDVVPNATAPLSSIAGNGIVVTDLGTSLSVNNTGFATSFAAQAGSWTGSVNESGYEPDASYGVIVTPNWATTVHITAKTTAGFTINFGTAAPASATVDWFLVR